MDVKRIALIGILVVLAFFIFSTLMNRSEPDTTAAPVKTIVEKVDYTSVLTVADILSRGSVVRDIDLVWMDWPTEALTPALITEEATMSDEEGAQTLADSVIGAIVREQVIPGEPATLSKFIRAGDAGAMSVLLKPGMRAVTVGISVDTASGGFIQPGDKVDVILRSNVISADGSSQTAANTIFSNVTVLAIDQAFRNNAEAGAAITGSNATLELSLSDSEQLIAAQADGEIALVLRGFTRSSSYAASRATQKRRNSGQAAPLKIYRSGQAETVLVQER